MKLALALAVGMLSFGCGSGNPEPTPTPTPDWTAAAKGIAERWVDANPDTLAELVTEVVIASPQVEERVPALLRVNLKGLVAVTVEEQLGSTLTVSTGELAYHGDARASATFIVAGTTAVDVGPFEEVEVEVPLVLTVDLDAEDVAGWEADGERAQVTLR